MQIWSWKLAEVDPFVIQWPRKWVADQEIAPVIQYLNKFLHDLWARTGGGTDFIDNSITEITNISIRESYPWDLTPTPRQFRAVTKSLNYTLLDFDYANFTSSATAKFPEFPKKGAVIAIRNGSNGTVKLDGNGKNINGSSTGNIRLKETSIDFYYFIDSDEWFAK